MGRASAEVFVREGARVVAVDISGAGSETAAARGSNAVGFKCNVTIEDEVEGMIHAAYDNFGRLDAVLNSATLLLRHLPAVARQY